jgi:hypothetical protein
MLVAAGAVLLAPFAGCAGASVAPKARHVSAPLSPARVSPHAVELGNPDGFHTECTGGSCRLVRDR